MHLLGLLQQDTVQDRSNTSTCEVVTVREVAGMVKALTASFQAQTVGLCSQFVLVNNIVIYQWAPTLSMPHALDDRLVHVQCTQTLLIVSLLPEEHAKTCVLFRQYSARHQPVSISVSVYASSLQGHGM